MHCNSNSLSPSFSLKGPLAWAIAAGVVEGKLVPELNAQLQKVGNFYADIDRIAIAASDGIDETKNRLRKEIDIISNLKIATEETSTFVSIEYIDALRDTIVESATNLISKCKAYTVRYLEIFPN